MSYGHLLTFDYKSQFFENDFYYLLPDLFFITAPLFLTLYAVIYSTSLQYRYPLLHKNAAAHCLYIISGTALLLYNSPLKNGTVFFNIFICDEITLFFKIIICIGGYAVIFLSKNYMEREGLNNFEYLLLLLLSMGGMFFLTSSFDFISMYLCIELQSLCFYVSAASKRYSEFSTEAGLKYFLLGAFSSGLLLFGLSFIYGFTGSSNFSDSCKIFFSEKEWLFVEKENFLDKIEDGWGKNKIPIMVEGGYIFLFIGLLFKLTAAPFHMWSPDVYEGAPTPITAFFAITAKSGILAIMIRIYYQISQYGESGVFFSFLHGKTLYFLLFFSSIASMIIGCFAALAQNKIKRILAYSSIAHVGYILLAFCCNSLAGYQSILIYYIIYVILNIGVFTLLCAPVKRIDLPEMAAGSKYITDFSLCAKTNSFFAFSFAIFMFALAGIPPLAGFYNKAFLFFATLQSGLLWSTLLGIGTSVVSCFYYIRFIKIMYFDTPRKYLHYTQLDTENAYLSGSCFFIISLLLFWTAPIDSFSSSLALSLHDWEIGYETLY